MTSVSVHYNPAASVLDQGLPLPIVSIDAGSERSVDPVGKGPTNVDANHRRWSEDYNQSSGGYELAFSAVICSLIGLWLDRRLGTTPWLTISFAVLAFAGSVANIYYRYQRDIAREEEAARLRRTGS